MEHESQFARNHTQAQQAREQDAIARDQRISGASMGAGMGYSGQGTDQAATKAVFEPRPCARDLIHQRIGEYERAIHALSKLSDALPLELPYAADELLCQMLRGFGPR